MNLIRTFPGITAHDDWVIELTDPVSAHALLNLLNVRYLLTPPTVALQEGVRFRLVERSDFGILENLDVWPRAFFTDKIASAPSTEAFIKYLSENGRKPFVVLTPEDIVNHPSVAHLQNTAAPTITSATNYQLLANSTSFDIRANSPGVVCLTEGQARDFTALANGLPAEVFTVNRAFKGIYLERPGNYHIAFNYRPHHWRLACVLRSTAAGLTILLVFWNYFCGRKSAVGAAGS
jgi:hypothetical protein